MDSRTGERITVRQAENGVYIWELTNPLYFKMYQVEDIRYTRTRVYHVQIRFNHNLRRALGLHKAFLNFQVWTTSLTASGTTYLNRFKYLVMLYIDQLGVISVNNVIRAVRFATDRSYVNAVLENHSIKFKLY
ncbi:replication enhancer protein [Tomato common mosaic virus]|uniref:Replication enhancer n=1 Tax=Tomato common mosaic virus TaxID=536084 RepID=B3GNB9_9GEMI|nr:replication enhancer protein [Tomato common mosaic virus]ACD93176.1 replication enhancer protein [Tomato common mosaic virus]AGH29756.1 replication-enhancer protein [Tomato common mosaic virus]AGH29761.1 replication-enhancer protein [Tomato common mosaic virus]AGH29766.1 replication-enhancer protein [Tomato common mosaic virus]AGH29771.1 replication-enhancer protein [Tomato common mosaic virus]